MAKFTKTYTVVGPLTMIVYPNEKGDGFIAHSLPTDTVAEGASPDVALANLRESLEDLVTYHSEKNTLSELFSRCAPAEYWAKMTTGVRVDARTLNLMATSPVTVSNEEAMLRFKMLKEANKIDDIVSPSDHDRELAYT
jgi:hypothetical protein